MKTYLINSFFKENKILKQVKPGDLIVEGDKSSQSLKANDSLGAYLVIGRDNEDFIVFDNFLKMVRHFRLLKTTSACIELNVRPRIDASYYAYPKSIAKPMITIS